MSDDNVSSLCDERRRRQLANMKAIEILLGKDTDGDPVIVLRANGADCVMAIETAEDLAAGIMRGVEKLRSESR